MKITPDLKLIWKREYRVSPVESRLHEKFFDAIEMPDGGFVVCGRAFGPLEDSTNSNGWVIRVDHLGCLEPGCDTLFTAVDDSQQAGVEIALYPNPTVGQFTISVSDNDVLLGVKLVNPAGVLLQDVQFLREARVREAVFNLESRPAGVYAAMIRTDRGWAVRSVLRSE